MATHVEKHDIIDMPTGEEQPLWYVIYDDDTQDGPYGSEEEARAAGALSGHG